ncbi:hypothetical protein [Planctomonas psychrotolerans]|uniref:hypothetical protein n=1 Tax=Planctomonas psychrotolerans TaxID=2528712 RepID=UPI001238EF3A|nr:hypothetical protein [Planctomonas psychrotolerans]
MAAHTQETSGGVRRAVIVWSVVAVLFVSAFAGAVAILNATVFSAPAFARSYLDALAGSDGGAALAHPGVVVPDTGSRALLNGVALGTLDDIALVSDEADDDDGRTVRFSYTSEGAPGSTEFSLRHVGRNFLFFDGWEFARSPVATVRVQVQHATGFTANGLVVPTDGDPTPIAEDGTAAGAEYAVFTPSTYVLSHRSRYVDAGPVRVAATEPGAALDAVLTAQPNAIFVEQAQREINAYLSGCATQRVLLPAGCPFGKAIRDRIEGEPTWSIARMPAVTLQPYSADPNDRTWLVPEIVGTANIVVDVKSLFDGSVRTLDEDVPFGVSYRVTIQPDGTLMLQGL